ncbi:MAG TPA: ATP synthase F1 subunit delta [Bryobacteraceae bacterium]|jgi:F-type H+-transporting ATPase subunit delta|nr:ATP synthase F1 subunit delta [Bryobacteraceae bacterium]
MTNALSVHYAQALADAVFAPDANLTPEQAVHQLRIAVQLLEVSPDLHRVLQSPAVSRGKKIALVGRLIEKEGLARLIRNFLMVIVEHRRVKDLRHILESFEEAVDVRLGLARVEITSATDLTDEQKQAVEEALMEATGKRIRPLYRINGAIIGGVIARIGSKEYDGSLLGRLQALRQQLSPVS